MRLKPFFSFYGSKWRVAQKYPEPQYGRIVEPFAGSAGYSLTYSDRKIVLVEKDEIIHGLWSYLIRVPAADIRSLPVDIEHIDEVSCNQESKWLIGFWLNNASSMPKKKRHSSQLPPLHLKASRRKATKPFGRTIL